MNVTIRFTENGQTESPASIGSAGPPISGDLARRLLFLRDETVDFDKGNYRRNRYGSMEVAAGYKAAARRSVPAEAHLCRQVRRVSAGASPQCEPIYLITSCEMDEREADRFLTQFDGALAFLKEQRGFLGFRLFENLDPAAPLRFINVACWSSISEFVAAFSSAAFKSRIQGGFDYRSEIMVARRALTHRAHLQTSFRVQTGDQAI